MTRRIITALTIAALTLGPVAATPAVALGEKDRKALTLLLGAAAIGLIINESNKKKRKSAKVSRHRNTYGGYYDDGRTYNGGRREHARDQYRGHKRNRLIPTQCVYPIKGAYGRRSVVSKQCLRDVGHARRLPNDCAFSIRDKWGSRTVYGTRCLRRNGFEIARVR